MLVLMFFGAFAELATFGALLPFLSVITDPGAGSEHWLVRSLFELSGVKERDAILWQLTLLFAAVAMTAGALRVLLAWLSDKFVFRLGYDLGMGVYRRTLQQPYDYFISHHTSEVLAAINTVEMLASTVLLPVMQLLIAALSALFILIALLMIDAKTALLAGGAFASLYVLATAIMRRRLQAASGIIARAQAQRIQCVQEGLGGIRNVLLDHTQDVYLRKFSSIDLPLRDAQASASFIAVAPRYSIEALGMILIAALAYGLNHQAGGVSAAIPILGALALGAQKLLPLLNQIYHGWTRLTSGRGLMLDVIALLEMPVPEARGSELPLPFIQGLRLERVSFRYAPEAPLVLDELSFELPKGTRLGVVGKSGSGKSTLLDVLLGLLPPTSGRLLVDGEVLTRDNLRAWQRQVTQVPQAIYLADASIAENIAFGLSPEDIDMGRVRRAAIDAQIADLVDSLPEGFETRVGELGVRLSGGQRQRIGIARALYKGAKVLILDEATSALDDATERAVIECIEALDRRVTVVIVAHRLSTVKMCDLVLKIDEGRIVAAGTYEEVVGASIPPAGGPTRQPAIRTLGDR